MATMSQREGMQNHLTKHNGHLDKIVEERTKKLLCLNKKLKQRLRDSEAQLQEIRTQLLQAGKLAALGTLGAGVAHELNNPLTVVSAEADEILDSIEGGYFDQKLAAICAKNIKTHAERMRVIIDHIREYTREAKPSEWKQLSVNEPIKDALILLKTQLDNSGINVHVSLSENLPKIWGHHNKLESVFQNLITNARDAFAAINDGREKKLSISTHLNGKNTIEVKFRDNGCGMSEQILRKIFKPYFTTKDVGNGTGLGLSIAQSNVHEHRGNIIVKSQVGQGTEFILTFPLERRNPAMQAKS
jgi:C4-dicarboxylate-specific signal transduction histidine kinase